LETPPLFSKVVFHRGLHFQQCNTYLVEAMYVRDKGHQPGYPSRQGLQTAPFFYARKIEPFALALARKAGLALKK